MKDGEFTVDEIQLGMKRLEDFKEIMKRAMNRELISAQEPSGQSFEAPVVP